MTQETLHIINSSDDIDVKKLNKDSYKAVFELYFYSLCSFAYRFIPDTFIVEDLVQETFISLWNKKNDFEHLNALKSFLYTSVRNKCLNHIKHQIILKKREEGLLHELESDQNFSGNIIEEETFNQLYQEIKRLPKASQEVMLLALNGLKNQEIADELEISINTVKTQKKIAYSKLKNRIHPILNLVLLSL